MMLTDKKIRGLNEPGRFTDARGLYVRVWPGTCSKHFYLATQVAGKRYDLAVGEYPAMSLAAAREHADALRARLKAGKGLPTTPEASPVAKKLPVTFGECANEMLSSIEEGFANLKHRKQWRSTLEQYLRPIWGDSVEAIGVADIEKCLKDIWRTKTETAQRVRGRAERVFDWAITRGHRTAANPATNVSMKILLGKPNAEKGHHEAMPYADVPAFWSGDLESLTSTSADALRFAMLTAARSGEVRLATWNEIDLESKMWTVPAARMKAKREHRVPLVDEAVNILERRRALHGANQHGYVFQGAKKDRPMSDMTLLMCLRGMRPALTVHGFRSSFRDWAGDETDHPREVAEAALAHVVGDKAEQAYRRGDGVAKRRKLMEDWANFVTG